MTPEKRPTVVTVLGWAWILIGAFMCFAAVLGLWVSHEMAAMAQGHGGLDGAAGESFPFWQPTVVAQLALSVFSVVTAVRFLRRRSRARLLLEVLTWILLVWVIGFTGYALYSFDRSPAGSPMTGGVVALPVAVMFLFGAPLAVMLKLLRSDEVRSAMTDAGTQ